VSNATIKKTGSAYIISFTAPMVLGMHTYRVDLVSNSKIIASSNPINVKVVEGRRKEQLNIQLLGIIRIGSGILPIEVFIASLSTLCLLSFIFWRRYRV
ncbi:MAG: hypothetical protein DRO08_00080, partial [Thermoprotei archaeon]